MTKTISLSDDAYDALVAVRHEGESFSALARRLVHEAARRDLFDRSLGLEMTEEDARQRKAQVRTWRDDPRNQGNSK